MAPKARAVPSWTVAVLPAGPSLTRTASSRPGTCRGLAAFFFAPPSRLDALHHGTIQRDRLNPHADDLLLL